MLDRPGWEYQLFNLFWSDLQNEDDSDLCLQGFYESISLENILTAPNTGLMFEIIRYFTYLAYSNSRLLGKLEMAA